MAGGMSDYASRTPGRWRRVPLKRLRAFVARMAGRCRVYFWDEETDDYTLYLWSQAHGGHCLTFGRHPDYSVWTPGVGNG